MLSSMYNYYIHINNQNTSDFNSWFNHAGPSHIRPANYVWMTVVGGKCTARTADQTICRPGGAETSMVKETYLIFTPTDIDRSPQHICYT